MFRVRREIEGLVFGVTGTPAVSNHHVQMDADEKNARIFRELCTLMTTGDRDEKAFETAKQLQKGCIERVVNRFQKAGTQLVIIVGHVHPRAEAQMPQKRKELLGHIRVVTDGKSLVMVVDEELPTPLAEHYSDYTHIDVEHRNEYTRAVFELLRKRKIF